MIKKEEIEKLASLSRIKLSSEEIENIQKDIDSILDYINRIKKVSGIKESQKNTENFFLRDDEGAHQGGLYTKEILSQSPEEKDGYFVVKKIL